MLCRFVNGLGSLPMTCKAYWLIDFLIFKFEFMDMFA